MRNTIDLIFTLKQVRLFSEIPDHVLADVAELIEIVEVPKGDQFIEEGDVADGLFIIKSGHVKVHTDQTEICRLGPPELVGELGVIATIKRSASVTALEDCILYKIHRKFFMQLIKEIPEITPPILQVLAERLIKTNQSYIDIRGQL